MINEAYDDGVIEQVKESFNQKEMRHVMLQSFFDKKDYDNLVKYLKGCKKDKIRIADRYSYSILNCSDLDKWFGEDFKFMISKIVGKKIGKITFSAREFGWKDYTLLHDSENNSAGLDIFFFICRKEWDYFWGGSKVYKTEKGKSHIFTPVPNSLCVVDRRKEDLSFIQYLNHYVGDERIIFVEMKID